VLFRSVIAQCTPSDSANKDLLALLSKKYTDKMPKVILSHPYSNSLEDLQSYGELYSGYVAKPITRSRMAETLLGVFGIIKPENRSEAKGPSADSENEAKDKAKFKILVAEDNKTNQLIIVATLKKLGYSCDLADDGALAVELLKSKSYSMILMDCQMPNMDGFQATKYIREPESPVLNHQIPIIALTANALVGDRERCIECGMDDYLTKPIKRAKLENLLNSFRLKEAEDSSTTSILTEHDQVLI